MSTPAVELSEPFVAEFPVSEERAFDYRPVPVLAVVAMVLGLLSAMAFFGMQPLGGLLVGSAAHAIGAPLTVLLQGIATLLIAVLFFPFLRRDVLLRKQRMKLRQVEERVVRDLLEGWVCVGLEKHN